MLVVRKARRRGHSHSHSHSHITRALQNQPVHKLQGTETTAVPTDIEMGSPLWIRKTLRHVGIEVKQPCTAATVTRHYRLFPECEKPRIRLLTTATTQMTLTSHGLIASGTQIAQEAGKEGVPQDPNHRVLVTENQGQNRADPVRGTLSMNTAGK